MRGSGTYINCGAAAAGFLSKVQNMLQNSLLFVLQVRLSSIFIFVHFGSFPLKDSQLKGVREKNLNPNQAALR